MARITIVGLVAVVVIVTVFGAYLGSTLYNSTTTFHVSETTETLCCSTESQAPESLTSASTTVSTSTQTTVLCTISTEPTGFFLHVVTDGTPKPIVGASVTVTPVSTCSANGPYVTLSSSVESFATNSSGWATITPPSISGPYYLIFNVQYYSLNSTRNLPKIFNVGWSPQQGTFVTLSVPSGTVTTDYLFPTQCNGNCTFVNIPQVVTILQTVPATNYTIQLWTNSTQSTSPISNASLITSPTDRTQVVQFYLAKRSFVFVQPSYPIIPNSNGSAFYLRQME